MSNIMTGSTIAEGSSRCNIRKLVHEDAADEDILAMHAALAALATAGVHLSTGKTLMYDDDAVIPSDTSADEYTLSLVIEFLKPAGVDPVTPEERYNETIKIPMVSSIPAQSTLETWFTNNKASLIAQNPGFEANALVSFSGRKQRKYRA